MSRHGTADRLFEAAVAASLALHLLAWGLLRWRFSPAESFGPALEVDLTAPFRPRLPGDTRAPGASRGAPAPAPKKTPGATGPKPEAPKAASEPIPVPPSAKTSPEKPWVLPGPNTKVLEKPGISAPAPAPVPVGAAPGATGPGGEGGRGGSGGGTGTGEALVNRAPRLVNAEEIRALLRSAYPESERAAGHEGKVVVALGIDAGGAVRTVEVIGSGGEPFDEAARTVARRMIFEPALVRSAPTAVRVRQAIVFRLSDQ